MDSSASIPPSDSTPLEALGSDDLRRLLILASRTAVLESTARGLVHDIRNPLQAIALAIHGLPESPSEPDVAFVTSAVDHAATHLTRTASTMSEIFQAGGDQIGPIDLSEVIDFIRDVERFQRSLPSVTLDVMVPPALPAVTGITVGLSHAIMNLVINAKEAMKGYPTPGARLTIGLEDRGETVRISVTDDGPGVTGEDAWLFQPFASTKPGHLGLGLPVARLLVESFGGSLRRYADRPAGARFDLDLPVWPHSPPLSGGLAS